MRDVAYAHLQTVLLDSLKDVNGRFLVASESLWFSEIIKALKDEEKQLGVKIKTKILGNLILTIGKLINPEIKHIMPFINTPLQLDGLGFSREFAINQRDARMSIQEMAQ